MSACNTVRRVTAYQLPIPEKKPVKNQSRALDALATHTNTHSGRNACICTIKTIGYSHYTHIITHVSVFSNMSLSQITGRTPITCLYALTSCLRPNHIQSTCLHWSRDNRSRALHVMVLRDRRHAPTHVTVNCVEPKCTRWPQYYNPLVKCSVSSCDCVWHTRLQRQLPHLFEVKVTCFLPTLLAASLYWTVNQPATNIPPR